MRSRRVTPTRRPSRTSSGRSVPRSPRRARRWPRSTSSTDGRHVGSATGLRLDPARAADLVAMWVEPEWRRRGIGQRLVEGVCRWAARQGSASIELDVRELNTGALDLYRRCGFEVIAGPHPAEAAPDLMELRMRRWLDVPPPGPVVKRLRRQGALVDQLEELPASDLRSLLLHVTRRRAAGLEPAGVLQARRDDATLAPVAVDGRALQLAGLLAIDAAPGFEPVTLSPVAPAGVNTVLGGLDQNLSLATVRGGEVLADPTTSLALEVGPAAARRRGLGAALLGGTSAAHATVRRRLEPALRPVRAGQRRAPAARSRLRAGRPARAHRRPPARDRGTGGCRPRRRPSGGRGQRHRPAARALPRGAGRPRRPRRPGPGRRSRSRAAAGRVGRGGGAVRRAGRGRPAAGAGAGAGVRTAAESSSRTPGSASASAGWRGSGTTTACC